MACSLIGIKWIIFLFVIMHASNSSYTLTCSQALRVVYYVCQTAVWNVRFKYMLCYWPHCALDCRKTIRMHQQYQTDPHQQHHSSYQYHVTTPQRWAHCAASCYTIVSCLQHTSHGCQASPWHKLRHCTFHDWACCLHAVTVCCHRAQHCAEFPTYSKTPSRGTALQS